MYKKYIYAVVLIALGLAVFLGLKKSPTDSQDLSSYSEETNFVQTKKQAYNKNGMPNYYASNENISGNLNSIGSDTLANLMTLWSEKFKSFYPGISLQIQAAGSSTAPAGLINGTSSFGPMSRGMKKKEIDDFVKKFGYEPTKIPVALDGLAIYVNSRSRLTGLSIPEIDAIFSNTRKCGFNKPVTMWSNLDETWPNLPIEVFGRNSVSGTYGYFKKIALCKGDFKKQVNEQPGSASVVQSVASDPYAIGYSGMGYDISGVRLLKISKKKTINPADYVEPTTENITSGSYPLSRFLYIYVNKHPVHGFANNAIPEFIKMVLSEQGQRVVEKDGFVPLSADLVKKYRNKALSTTQ